MGAARYFLFFLAFWSLIALADDQDKPIDPALGCKTNPKIVGRCFIITGRVGIFNGTPSVRISRKGGGRLLAVVPSEQEIMPEILKNVLTPEQDIYAEMEVCPMSAARPRQMQMVCIESARIIKQD